MTNNENHSSLERARGGPAWKRRLSEEDDKDEKDGEREREKLKGELESRWARFGPRQTLAASGARRPASRAPQTTSTSRKGAPQSGWSAAKIKGAAVEVRWAKGGDVDVAAASESA